MKEIKKSSLAFLSRINDCVVVMVDNYLQTEKYSSYDKKTCEESFESFYDYLRPIRSDVKESKFCSRIFNSVKKLNSCYQDIVEQIKYIPFNSCGVKYNKLYFDTQYLMSLKTVKTPFFTENPIREYFHLIIEKLRYFSPKGCSYKDALIKKEKLKVFFNKIIKIYNNKDFYTNTDEVEEGYYKNLRKSFYDVDREISDTIQRHLLTPKTEVKTLLKFDCLVVSYTNNNNVHEVFNFSKYDVVINLASWHKGNHCSPFFYKEVRDSILELEEFKPLKDLIKLD